MAKIQLNGKKITLRTKTTIYDLLKKFKLNNKKVAIEHNGAIVPKGKYKKHLLYHVKHSVIKQSQRLTKSFQNINKKDYLEIFKKIKKLMKKDLNYFFPKFEFKFTNNFFISKRVLFKNKNDSRISSILEPEKNYFLIASAKIDHSVDIANKIDKKMSKRL